MFQRLKALFEKRPLPEFRHSELGLLTFDSGLWSGKVRRGGRDISFVISGTESSPDSILTNALLSLLHRFPQTESRALQFLYSLDASVAINEFTFQSVNFLCLETPDNFTLEFTLKGGSYAIWRVEFESGQPKYSGRDDGFDD